MPIRVPLLEIHAAHACNLTCESCSHFSNSGHKGLVALDEADAWMKIWNRRIVPGLFRILGGEATLHPGLPELIELAAQNWPRSRIGLTTNGFFLHRHSELPRVLSRHNVILRLTLHHKSEPYRAKAREIVALIAEWRKDHVFEVVIEKAYERWTRRHHGVGDGVLPYEDADPRRSWTKCPCKNCMQLFRGRLWKCSPIAYLRLQKEAHPGISAKWNDYLGYEGLAPDCSEDQLRSFLGRKEEAICGMCSAAPERFDKRSPLISRTLLRQTAKVGRTLAD